MSRSEALHSSQITSSVISVEILITLDNMMKERSHEGVGKCPECESITAEHEQILWENVLGESNPDQLRKTVFFFTWLPSWIKRL